MRRYALFVFDDYYPGGGWHDFVGTFDSVEAAKAHPDYGKYDNSQIIDLLTEKEVR
jgi:hypothetical protein